MSELFNENMTYPQVRNIFFQAVRGKSESEIEKIKEEYSKIVPVITRKEMENWDPWTLSNIDYFS